MRNNTNVKYYIYLRKSSEGEDRQIQSIERQADEVHTLIANQGLTVVGTFQECRSAMVPFNRPEFSKMLKGIKAGKADGIICWHMNRLARNPLESGIIQQLLEDGKLHSIVTRDREYTAADNSIIISVESSLATQYSKDLGKMVKSGLHKKVAEGIAPHKAPIGYLNTKKAEHGSNYILKDTERFEIIRKIWDLMLTGLHTPTKILDMINTEIGLKKYSYSSPTVFPIARSTIYRILTDPFYAGLFRYNGNIHQGKHPAMITVDEYDQVQKLLGRKGRPRYQVHNFPYTGMISCGGCGSAITATEKQKLIKSTGLMKSYQYYYCTHRKKGAENCSARKVLSLNELESLIYEELNKISISDKFKEVAIKILKDNNQNIVEHEQAIYIQKKNEVTKLEKEIKGLLQMRLSDSITEGEYKEARKERDEKLVFIKAKLNQSEYQKEKLTTLIEKKFLMVANLKERFKKAPDEEKKAIFYSLGKNHVLKDKKLLIDKHNWLKSVEKNKEAAEHEIRWLELEKYIDLKSFNTYLGDMFPIMRSVVDDVGTEIKKELRNKGDPDLLTPT
jgi:site-specific DNA recombinase